MPTLYPIAHRVLGRVNVAAPEEEPSWLSVTRVLFMDEQESREGPWIITDIMAWEPESATAEHIEAVRTLGSHYSDWKRVCDAFNANDFDPADYEAPECVCGECGKDDGSSVD